MDTARFGVALASLGMHPTHSLELKLASLQKAGIQFAELGFEGYMTWVKQLNPGLPASTAPVDWSEGGEPDPTDSDLWDALYDHAPKVVHLAKSYGVTFSVLQPLNQFEGWPADHPRAEWSRQKAEKWLPLCSRLQVEFLQVGSNDSDEASATVDKYAQDLHWLGELAAQQSPPVKIAYESWCFSTHVNSWEQTWEIVRKANHPNVGICLDVAHFPLAPRYGWDPLTGKGWTDADFQGCSQRISQIPSEKIFYVELADVVRPSIPLGQGSEFDEWRDQNKPARGDRFTWAVCGRPVPLVGSNAGRNEDRGGARVSESVKAIMSTGFKGLFMFEQFEAQFQSGGDPSIPERYAAACEESWGKILAALR